MADPQRLVDDPDASPLARDLLASAAGDAPGSRNRAAVAGKLGIAAGLLAASGEVGAGGVIGAMWWKISLLVLALGGAITGGVALTHGPASEPAVREPAVREPAAAAAAAEPAAEPAIESIAPSVTPAAPAPVAGSTPRSAVVPASAQAPRPAAPPLSAPAPPVEPGPPVEAARAIEPPVPDAPLPPVPSAPVRRLAAEVAILDRARAALRRGDTGAATAALDEHARDFADGALLAEAELVRIEALARAGDADLARRRARDFLVRFPQSPLARRLRSLVDRLPPPAKESP